MRVAIGQFGGPTAVLNASLYGALTQLDLDGATVFGVVGGGQGLVSGDFISLTGRSQDCGWLATTPGAALRAGRFAAFADRVDVVVRHLRQRGIDGLLVIGGNGTMALADLIRREAISAGYGLQVMGVPKTIDNDLPGVDHTPGYPSAAHFLLGALRDLAHDLDAMAGFEQVRVVEVMGRHTGWLAAVAALLPHLASDVGHGRTSVMSAPLVYIPERPLDPMELLEQVRGRVDLEGYAMVVVSEGIRSPSGQRVTQMGVDSNQAANVILGGVGAQVAHLIRQELGLGVRYENPGILQRCWTDSMVPLDRKEAIHLGQEGATALLRGETGQMVGHIRNSPAEAVYATQVVRIPFEQVAGRDRCMTPSEQLMDARFVNWLRPLVGFESLRGHPGLSQLSGCLGVDTQLSAPREVKSGCRLPQEQS